MEEINNVVIHISIEPNIVNVPYTSSTNAEEICTNICKQLNLLPVSRTLFALRIQNSGGFKLWLPANSKLLHGNKYEFRMRFKVSSLNSLMSLDKNAYDYYFHQARRDVLENQIPEISYAKHKSEILGLGVVDMYREMIEHKVPAEELEKNYKKYIPREISKKHSIFTKKPIHISLGRLKKQTLDVWFVKNEYLKQVDSLAPNYLAEEYTAMTDIGCGSCLVNIMVAPYHKEQPGVRVCYDNKEWEHLCTIDDLCFISIRTDSTVEISRRNGIPSYLKFNSVNQMLSFVSVLDGYYRLSVKWTFNLCKDVTTPSLKALNAMKCHGPVGGEFSYAKLEEKRCNKHGCYIIRECKQDFHTYFIDVCTRNEKPETYKVSLIGNEWILHSNGKKYESLSHLISSYSDSQESPYLNECVPPSEYDKSPLLLCEPVVTAADSKACISDVEGLLRAPHCINPKDIQYFKGPWCYVDSEDADNLWEKDYCDIPFCDDKDCMVFTKNSVPEHFYSQYTFLNGSLRNLSFSVKIWNPDDFLFAEARIVLSVFALPASSQQINDWETGIEIIISNNGLEGVAKPVLISEYKETNNSMSFESGEFLYYSLLGSNVLWSFPFCDDEDFCDVHVTFKNDFPRFYPMERTNSTRDIRFFVRGHNSAVLRLKHSPTILYPRVTIMLGIEGNKTRIILEYKKDGDQVLLQDVSTVNILRYWSFREFSLSIFGDQLQLFWLRSIGTQTVFEVAHDEMRKLRWFAPGSLDTEVHWSFYCKPDMAFHIKPAWPPECAVTQAEIDYAGTQSVTRDGQPCLPWISSVIPYEFRADKKFVDSSVLEARNYCRNTNRDSNGPFCFALNLKNNGNIEKKYCKIRDCQSAECRMAGTGNDYIGKLNVTRSNRTCQSWINGTIHVVDQLYLNESLYADGNISVIENFCRDPSRNIAGPWCYTTDPAVVKDLCYVPDCSKDEECIILAMGTTKGRHVYILPFWKETGPNSGLHFSLKQWDPDLQDGLIFQISSMNKSKYYELFLGAENNEKVLLTYTFDFNQTITLKEKTLPHLIPSGKWGNFWLQIPKGSVRLGYEGSPYALFEWDSRRSTALKDPPFEPIFLSYRPISGNAIGISFPCQESHTENTTVAEFDRILSFKIWKPKVKASGLKSEETDSLNLNNITLYMRGSGVILIPLMLLPYFGDYYSLIIDDVGNSVSLIRNTANLSVSLDYVVTEQSVLMSNNWTIFNIIFNETEMLVLRSNITILNYTSADPMLIYWFSVAVQKGWVTWIANSHAPDIDGPPLDGGWGAWSTWKCSVSCGGGAGVRSRKCNNPEPNVFGKLCTGPYSSTGRCNEFLCGDISPNTEEEILKSLQKVHHSYTLKEYEDIDIRRPDELLINITKESPQAKFKWTLNGLFLKVDKTNSSRVEIIENSLKIRNVSVSDSGIYLLMLYRITNHKNVVMVASVTVETKTPTIRTRVSYDMMLKCHGVVLGTKKDSEEGMICMYRAMWKVARGKKVEVAMKVLKSEAANDHIKEFTDLAGKWAFLESSSIVRLYGVTLGSPVSMVMEYHSLGPLDQYLNENQELIQVADLVEAGSQLATALWTLQENGFVHGNIRCHKLLVSSHDENSLVVRLADPGLQTTYCAKDVHWIPPECYPNLEFAHKAAGADVWAFGTTLWEIFSNGKSPTKGTLNDTKRYYVNGKRLPQPEGCPSDIYNLMRDCWDIDPHRRRKPQEIMRDLNQILYQVFNSRRTHSYSTVFPKAFKENSNFNGSASSLFSNATDETFLVRDRDLLSASDMERDSNMSLSSGFSGGSSQRGWDLNVSQDLINDGSEYSISEMSEFLSNLNITQTTSLDSMHSMQCIFEVSADCNLILQGRIGQGFYGEVFRGTLEREQDTEPKLVAVKKLKTDALSSCLQDFEREIKIMMTLEHPNIVQILCALEDPDISLVMEYVQHGSLQSYLKIYRDTITTSHLLKFSLDIAEGMKYLGQKKIVHRDLAARNILVADEHHVKISDFGLAQVTEKGEYYILKTNRDLPIKWYAPESLRDGKFSTRSDVWSYGVTMFEMFSRGEDPKLPRLIGSPIDDAEPLKMLKALEQGIRLRQPSICPSIVYSKLMAPCWELQPTDRPTFLQLGLDATELLKQC